MVCHFLGVWISLSSNSRLHFLNRPFPLHHSSSSSKTHFRLSRLLSPFKLTSLCNLCNLCSRLSQFSQPHSLSLSHLFRRFLPHNPLHKRNPLLPMLRRQCRLSISAGQTPPFPLPACSAKTALTSTRSSRKFRPQTRTSSSTARSSTTSPRP